MVEVKTILVMNITACFLLAVSLRAAINTPLSEARDELWLWLASLVTQAIAYTLWSFGETQDLAFYHIVAYSVLAICITLQAAALFQFFGKRLSRWWHLFPALLIGVLFSLAAGSATTISIFAGVFFGSAYVILAVIAMQLGSGMPSAGLRLLVIGFSLGALSFFMRAIPVLGMPELLGGPVTSEKLLTGGLFLSFMVILLTSVGFLVLQKDRAEEAATKLAVTDPLTGTFNRRTFLELADKEIARARRGKAPLSVVLFDLDHFKSINDKYGHLAGDHVLKRFVQIAKMCLRQEDLLVRYGGEEFCLLLPETNAEEAASLAERIRGATEYSSFTITDGRAEKIIRITVSGGVAKLDESAADNIGNLVARADEAMYAAKAAGRNQIAVFPNNADFTSLTRSQRLLAVQPAPKPTGEPGSTQATQAIHATQATQASKPKP
jgi:diguanylate cyclase (GGDEF)-like protein